MRGLGYAAAVGALLVCASAQAQTIDATGLASGQIVQGTNTINVGAGQNIFVNNGEGGSVESIVNITTSTVSFESGVAVSGGFAESTSFSGVDITVTNVSDGLLSIENFGSTIIPAGLGFYLQDRDGAATDNNIFTGYGQTFSGLTFADLDPTVADGEAFAFSDFEFSVVSNEATLYSLSGSLSLFRDGDGIGVNYNLVDAAGVLNGFVTAYDNEFALAYAWDSTDIVIPLNALLEQDDSQVIQYRTRVTSRTRASCITDITCLVAYSGFGDPIGRGGGADLALAAFAFDGPTINAVNGITGIVFDPQTFTPFRFIDDGAVPEPSTWLMMILGFGFLGAALRRRRAPSYS